MNADELRETADACEVSARNLGTTISGLLNMAANADRMRLDAMDRQDAIAAARRTTENEIQHLTTGLEAAVAALEGR